jgi:hypothetical protein
MVVYSTNTAQIRVNTSKYGYCFLAVNHRLRYGAFTVVKHRPGIRKITACKRPVTDHLRPLRRRNRTVYDRLRAVYGDRNDRPGWEKFPCKSLEDLEDEEVPIVKWANPTLNNSR